MKRTYPALDLMAGAPLALLLAAGCGTGADTAAPSCDTTQWLDTISATEPAPVDIVGQCEHEPDISPEGQPACVVLEARVDEACVCDASETRGPVPAAHQGALAFAMASPEAQQHGWNCYCEVPALDGEERAVCQAADSTYNGEPIDGWCYIDATTSPPIGDPELVSPCPSDKQRLILLAGEAKPWPGRSAVIVCQREVCGEASSP